MSKKLWEEEIIGGMITITYIILGSYTWNKDTIYTIS